MPSDASDCVDWYGSSLNNDTRYLPLRDKAGYDLRRGLY
jgi:hypothetical protein